VQFLCNQESGLLLGLLGGSVGGRPDVYGAPELLQFPYRAVFKQVMDAAPAGQVVANGRQAEAEAALQRLLQPLWLGQAKPNPAFVEQITQQVQTILSQPPL
jgi:hypothetical protein